MSKEDEDDLVVQADGTEEEEQGNEAYVEYDIASYPSDLTLSGINEMWKNGDIVIPDFQREFVWHIKQSSLLVESFLLGLPVPPVFFYVDRDNKSLVIDGQQRIMSIIYFFDGLFGSESIQGKRQVFRLSHLAEKSPFYHRTYAELEDSYQRKFRNAVLRAVNIRQLSPSKEHTSIYHIFERLNTGGTPLKPQEIRNCVSRGDIVTILRTLNKDSSWRKILGKTQFDKHQKDVELVLRLLALFDNAANYEKPMKIFLGDNMEEHKDGGTRKVKKFQSLFPKVMKAIVDVLGDKPFHIRGPLNAAVLDSVLTVAIENPTRIDEQFAREYRALISDQDFLKFTQLGTTDTATLRDRYKLARKSLVG
jgi:hypothetical protein